MDETIMVQVYVATVSKRMDVILPRHASIEEIKDALCELLEEETQYLFMRHEHNVLYLTRNRCVLDDAQKVMDIPILQGDELIIW